VRKYTSIIIDDVEIDLLMVKLFVEKHTDFEVIGAFQSATKALATLEKNEVDIIFIDIDMPGVNGIEFRKKFSSIPVCVYITSHPEFAVESFELDALDFIVKPVTAVRFLNTVKRINDYLEIRNKAHLYETIIGKEFIFIKEKHTETKISIADIIYLEALKNYTILNTDAMSYKILQNIGLLLRDKNFENFIRVHKGFAVQKHLIQKISSQELTLINSVKIPLGRSYRDNLNFNE